MKRNEKSEYPKALSRREFAGKTLIAIAAAGTTGLLGYGILSSKRFKAVNNIRRMGHCAPSVMQTLLDINNVNNDDLVLYSGGMAGGIAGPGMECGVLTAPLMFLSYSTINPVDIPQKLEVLGKARSYFSAFNDFNGSTICIQIRKEGMAACMKNIRNFNSLYSRAVSEPVGLTGETHDSLMFLIKKFEENRFHCAHNVLNILKNRIAISPDLYKSSGVFVGGIAMMNRTCDALTAGVMTLSSATSKLEKSYLRVARMNKMLRQNNPNAMDEGINDFNRAINLSEELGIWFRNEFGSTGCFEIWRMNFSKLRDAESFISGNCMIQCRYIAEKVAEKVIGMLSQT